MRSTSRRAVLAVMAAAPASSLSALTPPGPILAAIAAHRQAVAAYEAAIEISGRLDDDNPEHPAAAAVTRRAFTALEDAGVALLAVGPTTLAGLAALLSHIADCARVDAGVWQLPDRLVEAVGEYQRAYGDGLAPEEGSAPFAYVVIGAAAEAIRRLAAAG